jgi:hypothetical protein
MLQNLNFATGYWLLAAGRSRDKQPTASDQKPVASGKKLKLKLCF